MKSPTCLVCGKEWTQDITFLRPCYYLIICHFCVQMINHKHELGEVYEAMSPEEE